MTALEYYRDDKPDEYWYTLAFYPSFNIHEKINARAWLKSYNRMNGTSPWDTLERMSKYKRPQER